MVIAKVSEIHDPKEDNKKHIDALQLVYVTLLHSVTSQENMMLVQTNHLAENAARQIDGIRALSSDNLQLKMAQVEQHKVKKPPSTAASIFANIAACLVSVYGVLAGKTAQVQQGVNRVSSALDGAFHGKDYCYKMEDNHTAFQAQIDQNQLISNNRMIIEGQQGVLQNEANRTSNDISVQSNITMNTVQQASENALLNADLASKACLSRS